MKNQLLLFCFICLTLSLNGQNYRYDLPGSDAGEQQVKRPYSYDLTPGNSGRIEPYTATPIRQSPDARPSAYDNAASKPAYCNDFPESYEKAGFVRPKSDGDGDRSLPRFSSRAVKEYKIQCAILSQNHPANYPFHPLLVARWRPCEEVWVVESRQSFKDRSQAEQLQQELKNLGYRGAYIIELIGYEMQ